MNLFLKANQIARAIWFNLRVNQFPDRQYLWRTMLPEIASTEPANVLLAGTKRYTARYPRAFNANKTNVWTIDFDARSARWGNEPFHRVCDICELLAEFPDTRFDVIHINGLLGFGVDTPQQIQKMIQSCCDVLTPAGYIMLGWDEDVTSDPLENESVVKQLRHSPFNALPARHGVTGCEGHAHVFDWFRKRD